MPYINRQSPDPGKTLCSPQAHSESRPNTNAIDKLKLATASKAQETPETAPSPGGGTVVGCACAATGTVVQPGARVTAVAPQSWVAALTFHSPVTVQFAVTKYVTSSVPGQEKGWYVHGFVTSASGQADPVLGGVAGHGSLISMVVPASGSVVTGSVANVVDVLAGSDPNVVVVAGSATNVVVVASSAANVVVVASSAAVVVSGSSTTPVIPIPEHVLVFWQLCCTEPEATDHAQLQPPSFMPVHSASLR